jgi:hypothetical protein
MSVEPVFFCTGCGGEHPTIIYDGDLLPSGVTSVRLCTTCWEEVRSHGLQELSYDCRDGGIRRPGIFLQPGVVPRRASEPAEAA